MGKGVDQMWISTFHDHVLEFLLKAMLSITENVKDALLIENFLHHFQSRDIFEHPSTFISED